MLTEPELAPLLDQFICARVINANALDLSLFQFDYDLSFSALIFNADRTLYGRFGSWTHQKNQHDKSTAGFKRALEAALQIHRGYPANKPALDGKYQMELDWNGKVVPSCVHCHQIGDALRLVHRNKGEPVPSELIYPMPAPETIGLTLAQEGVAKVEAVAKDSVASRAGLQAGDDLVMLNDQRLISIADFSWALHRAPASGNVPAMVKRGGEMKSITLALPDGWRSKSDISRRVGTWGLRGMASGGMVLEDLPDQTRAERGLKKDDVILRLGEIGLRLTEGELLGALVQKHHVGEELPVTVLRGEQRVELKLPMQ